MFVGLCLRPFCRAKQAHSPPPVIPKLRPWVATVVQVLIKSQLAIAQQCFVEQAKQGH